MSRREKESKRSGARPLEALLVLGALLAAGFVIYGGSLGYPYHLDDFSLFTYTDRLKTETVAEAFRAMNEGRESNRPVAELSFALVHTFFGDSLSAQRAVNVLIHVLAGLGIFLILRRTRGSPGEGGGLKPGFAFLPAFLATFLWLVHPVQVMAVAYLVQRMAALSSALLIWALYLHLGARDRLAEGKRPTLRWAAVFLLFFLALFTKESSIIFPFLLALVDFTAFRRGAAEGGKERQEWKVPWWAPGALLLPVCIAAAFYFHVGIQEADALTLKTHAYDDVVGGAPRIFAQPLAFVEYVSLLLAPLPGRLHVLHVIPDVASPAGIIAAALAWILLALGFGWAFRSWLRGGLAGLAVLWFLACLAPEAGPLRLEPVTEHRLYLASAAFFPLVLVGLGRLLGAPVRPRAEEEAAGSWKGLAVAVGVLALLLGAFSIVRAREWKDPIDLLMKDAEAAPERMRPLYLAAMRMSEPDAYQDLDRAEKILLQLRQRGFDSPKIHIGLSHIYLSRDRFQKGLEESLAALRLNPDELGAHINAAYSYIRLARFADAAREYAEVVRLDPDNVKMWYDLGRARRGAGDFKGAAEAFLHAARLEPDKEGYRMAAAHALLTAGEPAEARRLFAAALDRDPDNAAALTGFGRIALAEKDYASARSLLEKAGRLSPNPVEACLYLSQTCSEQGDKPALKKALECFLHYAGKNPEYVLDVIRAQKTYKELMDEGY